MPIVLCNRRCGSVKPGGLYATGVLSPRGTLLAFTALAAPFEAHVPNPRAPVKVNVPASLLMAGLLPDDFTSIVDGYNLPTVGVADLWGMASGYVTAWDAIEETAVKGISRRIAQVPALRPPYPVLMCHKKAVLDWSNSLLVSEWFDAYGMSWDTEKSFTAADEQSWRGARSLGRVGDDTFMWHPYVSLWEALKEVESRGLTDLFQHQTGSRLVEGAFGLSWVTAIAYVLKKGEAGVPEHLAEKGVIAAVPEGDPRGEQ